MRYITSICLITTLHFINVSYCQTEIPKTLSLPDNSEIIIPKRWYVSDESLVKKMKQQTTGSSSGLIYLLFPTKYTYEQKGYPFISIGHSHLGYQVMQEFTFTRFVDEHKKLLSGSLGIQLNEIAPHQFDELLTSQLYIDEIKNMVIYSVESGVPNYGQVVVYIAVIKSKTGLTRISLSSLKQDIAKYLPAFKILIKSFTYI